MLRKLQKRCEIALEHTTVFALNHLGSGRWGGGGRWCVCELWTLWGREGPPSSSHSVSLQEILSAFGGRNKLLAVIRKVCVPQSRTWWDYGQTKKERTNKRKKENRVKRVVTNFGLQLFFLLISSLKKNTLQRNMGTYIITWEHRNV